MYHNVGKLYLTFKEDSSIILYYKQINRTSPEIKNRFKTIDDAFTIHKFHKQGKNYILKNKQNFA